MESQPSHAARGRGLRLHPCWPIWSGGAPTIILRVLTNHLERRSCSRENEGATDWRNDTDNGRQPWQPAERTDDGQHARCAQAPWYRFPLESYASQRWLQGHVGGW